MKYCGINYSNNRVVIVSDKQDRIVFQKRLPNELGQICAVPKPHQEKLAAAIENIKAHLQTRSNDQEFLIAYGDGYCNCPK